MEDMEYAAYLKKQTYEDLLSIKTSINSMAQPPLLTPFQSPGTARRLG
jgi:hypothetical protein